jgi:hypothetical protein
VFLQSRMFFRSLFVGNDECFGQYFPPDKNSPEGEKESGKSITVSIPLTEEQYAAHLDGKTGLGIVPVTKTGTCRFTVIDVDVYAKEETLSILNNIMEYEFPIVAFKSKSGGLHLFTFYENFISAEHAIENAKYMRRCLGLPDTTEIFPKQTKIKDGKQGSWINLPYFNGDNTTRCLIKRSGDLVPELDLAVDIIKKYIYTEESFEAWKQTLPLVDAPPCLQTLYINGTEHMRNNYLFNLACYYKAKFDDQFPAYLVEANDRLVEPLKEQELRDTIINSITKNSYTYKCKEGPICDFCDKRECRTRAYAVGDAISSLSYERLIQYLVDPPYYEWTINSKVLRFFSEREIIKQDRFLDLCMRHLSVLPPKVKQETWTDIINTALLHMETITLDKDEDITENGQAKVLVGRFFKETMSTQPAKLLLGRVYHREEKGLLYFRGTDLINYIATRVGRAIDKREVYAWLNEKGMKSTVLKVSSKSLRLYTVPYSAFVDYEAGPLADEKPEEINWGEDDDEQEY